jgi:hypothetical protein
MEKLQSDACSEENSMTSQQKQHEINKSDTVFCNTHHQFCFLACLATFKGLSTRNMVK